MHEYTREVPHVLAKLTSKNQITLPKALIGDFRADAVRAKLAELGISEADVSEAVAWARRTT